MAKRKGRKKGRRREPAMDPYEAIAAAARGMTEAAFKPAITSAKSDIRDARAQRGVANKAFDRSKGTLADTQKVQSEATGAAVSHADMASGLAQGQSQALGGQQVAEAQQAASLYGQSADAAKIAAQNAGGAAAQLQKQGTDISGFLGALGAIQQGEAGRGIEANEVRRGEAQKQIGQEVVRRKDALKNLRVERAGKSGELASGMIKDERDFQLAADTLNMRNSDSMRDYRVAMKTLTESGRRTDILDQNADATLGETRRNNDQDNSVAQQNADTNRMDAKTRRKAEKRARKEDLADDGKINGSAGGASEVPKTTYKSGRAGVPSSPVTQTKLDSIRRGANGVRSQIKAGQRARSSGGDIDKALKASGLKGNGLVLAKAIATGQKIPRSLIPYLAHTIGVNQNELPNDIAKLVAR